MRTTPLPADDQGPAWGVASTTCPWAWPGEVPPHEACQAAARDPALADLRLPLDLPGEVVALLADRVDQAVAAAPGSRDIVALDARRRWGLPPRGRLDRARRLRSRLRRAPGFSSRFGGGSGSGSPSGRGLKKTMSLFHSMSSARPSGEVSATIAAGFASFGLSRPFDGQFAAADRAAAVPGAGRPAPS